MKVGILTYHRANNYGAYLQAYALTKTFEHYGYKTEIIDFNMLSAENQYKVRNKNLVKRYYENKRYNMFIEEQKKLRKSDSFLISENEDDLYNFIRGKYDLVCVGSDEIWKVDSFRKFPNPYWLRDYGDYAKISYAASSRSNLENLALDEKNIIINTLSTFKLIGVRDRYTYDQIEKLLESSEKLLLCCDPVFTYDFKPNKQNGKKILREKYKVDTNKPMLGVMSNDPSLAQKIKKKYGKEYELISLFRQWAGYKKTPDLTPFEWIDIIAALDVFITNYFHGVCFSLIVNTFFIAIDSRDKITEHGKIYDLLNRNGLSDNFFTTKETDYSNKVIDLCGKYTTVNYKHIVDNEKLLAIKYFNRLKGIFDEI